jgi:hypothetical protein
MHPFVSGGIAPRYASGSIHTIDYGYSPGPTYVTFSTENWNAHDYALVVGGGIDVSLGHVHISPQVRYLHWHLPSHYSPNDVATYLYPESNEAQVLLGIGWSRAR